MNPTAARRLGSAWVTLGLVLLGVAGWGLRRDWEWVAQPFYAWAWWGYILVLDGLCVLRRGTSLLTTRRRLFVPIALMSVTFWFFFELLNLRFQNWYYVGVFRIRDAQDMLASGTFVVLAFSTVFVGIFETIEALAALGFGKKWRGQERVLPPWVSYAVQGLGVAMAGVAILFPYYWAPLIWGSFTFLVDPWNYRHGARSILRDIEARDWGLIARVFVAGLVCGVVWESLNFFAPQKWIYTVRGLESFKLFEMPLLGFLGFPGLAYDCLAAYSLVAFFTLKNEPWEPPEDLAYTLEPRPQAAPRRFWLSVPLQVGFWAFVTSCMYMGTNIGSFEIDLDDLGITPAEQRELAEVGITRPRHLVRDAVERPPGLSADRWSRLAGRARLFTFKGIGSHYGELLERIGVRRAEDLASWSVEELAGALKREAATTSRRAPRLDIVRVWVLAARHREAILQLDV